MNAPLVSVVTATYNRANVLRFTIESLRAQTVTDWEMIVVGDACTDDTEEVIRSFDDPRIRFFNRTVNSGEQATPNNDGVSRARGRYLAFLNHDDLWARDHLAVCVDAIEGMNADLVWTPVIAIDRTGKPLLLGSSPSDTYEPYVVVAPASSWLMRREVAEWVGPWRPARDILVAPSQDWLHRAWKAGLVLRALKLPGVLAVRSGDREESYANRQFRENEEYAARFSADPNLLLRMAAEIAGQHVAMSRDLSVYRHLRHAFRNVIRRFFVAVRIHPSAVDTAFRHGRRGGAIDALRKTRGLPPLPRSGDLV